MKNLLIAALFTTSLASTAFASPITDLTPVAPVAPAAEANAETAWLIPYLPPIMRRAGTPFGYSSGCGPTCCGPLCRRN